MKILMIIGSGRRSGNTEQIGELLTAHLQQEARQHRVELEVETVYLGQQSFQFCRGCRVCFDRGEALCPLKDGALDLKNRMLAADGIVLASPVYVDDVSGLMKNFIDRMCHMCHRPQLAGKTAYAIATTGSSRTGKTLETMSMALRTWGCHLAGQTGFATGALMKGSEAKDRFDLQAARAARAIFSAVYRQAPHRPAFFSLMMFKIQQMSWRAKGKPGTLDFNYWQEQGWLDPKRTFYIDHEAGRLKTSLARLTGSILGKFVA
ncbi:MAG TPA: NAD(P)H-dependent oxidoreductase [Anaerolineaceae bacterium]|nr:NAD(P)H-dependent oxidoreductase [Anaerolineaceae bacterium]HPN49960.1 NAD(P)H-dependent oxidoreductase [Anaerolineaceae bacterium]